MAYKLLDAAQHRWRRCNGHQLLADVLEGAKFPDGIRALEEPGPDTVTDGKITA